MNHYIDEALFLNLRANNAQTLERWTRYILISVTRDYHHQMPSGCQALGESRTRLSPF